MSARLRAYAVRQDSVSSAASVLTPPRLKNRRPFFNARSQQRTHWHGPVFKCHGIRSFPDLTVALAPVDGVEAEFHVLDIGE
jgi:hypothetical protein